MFTVVTTKHPKIEERTIRKKKDRREIIKLCQATLRTTTTVTKLVLNQFTFHRFSQTFVLQVIGGVPVHYNAHGVAMLSRGQLAMMHCNLFVSHYASGMSAVCSFVLRDALWHAHCTTLTSYAVDMFYVFRIHQCGPDL